MPERAKAFRLLVVDDDEGLLVLISETLRSEGYPVAMARSGAQALARIAENPPDLMLLDLQLNDVGGRALIEQLEAAGRLPPFVVITGQGNEKVAVEMMKRRALDYVMKDTALLDLLPGIVRRAMMVIESERVLATSRAERARLQRELVELSEQEQRRIGSDLHDGLGQQLTAIELMCAALKSDAAGQPHLAVQVERIALGLREAVRQVRFLSHGLVPVSDDPDALYRGLVELVERTDALGRLKCRLECPEPVVVHDSAVAGHLYRIAQEAVNNALKYSGATDVTVKITQDAMALSLRITDNGCGLSGRKPSGIGLELMKYRASEIGAKITIESRRGRGVTITCTRDKTS